jgi:hypothetical protein
MKFSYAVVASLVLIFTSSVAAGQTVTSFGGSCDTTSNPGAAFVLNGLGQTSTHNCTFGPGSPTPSVFLGTLMRQNGTLQGLHVKQFELNSAVMGGTVTIWVNPKTGGLPVSTSISCSLGFSSSTLYLCSNTGNTFSVVSGDRVFAVVTPPPNVSISPVTATIDLTTTTTTTTPFSGLCGSVSFSTPFVLFGLGQMSDQNCVYGPGAPVQAFLGQVLTKTGTLRNLYVKQQQLNSAPFGGTVTVWINPKTGTVPVQTPISCTLSLNGSIATCNNTSSTFSVQTGDQVIVIVTPPGGMTVSPVTATIDVQ